MADQARAVLPAYLGLTVTLWAVLTVAGERSFVAFCHAMSAVSTSGISPVGGLEREDVALSALVGRRAQHYATLS